MTDNSKIFDSAASDYDNWFELNPIIFETELKVLKASVGEFTNACEIGVGTGRFAKELGIKTGIEPSIAMSRLAESRGITVHHGYGESIPIPDESFDLVLMNTVICFLSDISITLKEIMRILKPAGKLVIGMLDKDSQLGNEIEKNKANDKFFKNANLKTVDEILNLINENGFKTLSVKQTLTNLTPSHVEEYSEGHGEGNFVVITAMKIL